VTQKVTKHKPADITNTVDVKDRVIHKRPSTVYVKSHRQQTAKTERSDTESTSQRPSHKTYKMKLTETNRNSYNIFSPAAGQLRIPTG